MRFSVDDSVQYATGIIERMSKDYADIADMQLILLTAVAMLNVTQAENISLDEKTKRCYKKLKEITDILNQVAHVSS